MWGEGRRRRGTHQKRLAASEARPDQSIKGARRKAEYTTLQPSTSEKTDHHDSAVYSGNRSGLRCRASDFHHQLAFRWLSWSEALSTSLEDALALASGALECGDLKLVACGRAAANPIGPVAILTQRITRLMPPSCLLPKDEMTKQAGIRIVVPQPRLGKKRLLPTGRQPSP